MEEKFVKWSPPYRGENVARPNYDLVELEKDGQIGRIILNTPEKHNPLGYERLLQLEMAEKEMEMDDEIRVIIIKGQGKSFSAGYDLTPTKPGEKKRNTPQNGYIHPDRDMLWQSYDHEHLRVYKTLFNLQKPVIAQIHGNCLAGGSELAGFCDIRIVADDAKIGWPVGTHISPGNIQYVPWLMGMTRAKYYMFTCKPMTGKQAAEWAWASESVAPEELEQRTEEVARQIAQTPTDLIMLTKRSINRQFEIMGFQTGMDTSVEFLALAMFRNDFKMGDDDFFNKAREGGLKAAIEWREKKFNADGEDGAGGDGSGGDGSAEKTAPASDGTGGSSGGYGS